jgi:hypothetical protein
MSQLVDVESLAHREGFVVRQVVKDDYDAQVYVVEHRGQTRVLKTMTRPELRPNLIRDIGYSALVATLSSAGGDWVIRSSAPVASGDGWVLRELLAADPLLEVADVEGAAEVHDVRRPAALRRLAAALADLDRLSPDPVGRRPAYRDEAGEPVADDGQRQAELARWVRELAGRGALGELDGDVLLGRLAEDRGRIQPGFEMWDVKLEDFLDLPDGRVGIYDLEFAYLFGRRHYDLARLYATLAVPLRAPAAAAVLLGTYLEVSAVPREALAAACLPVLAETLLAELYSGALARSERRQHDARRQLARALAGGIDELLTR